MSERIEKTDTSYLNYKGKLPAAEFGASESYINSILDGSLVSDIHATATSEGKRAKAPAATADIPPQPLIPSVRPTGVGGQLNVVSSASPTGQPSVQPSMQTQTTPPAQPEFGGSAAATVTHGVEGAAETAALKWSDQEMGVAEDNGVITKGLLAVKQGLNRLFGPKHDAVATNAAADAAQYPNR